MGVSSMGLGLQLPVAERSGFPSLHCFREELGESRFSRQELGSPTLPRQELSAERSTSRELATRHY